jgi:cytidine deaminase
MKNQAIIVSLSARKLAVARKTFVGAALYSDDFIVMGYNVENRCQKGYHAEEMAILNAQLQNCEPSDFKGIIVTFSSKDISPITFACGHCRQFLWEYTMNSNFLITEVDLDGNIVAEKTLGELYPYPFPRKGHELSPTN